MSCPSPRLGIVVLIGLIASPARGQEPPQIPVPAPQALVDQIFAPPRQAALDPARLAGLRAGSKPELLTWERVYQLALIQARAPQPPRFAELDPARLADEARQVGSADIARFRADFAIGTKFRDPAPEFLSLQARLAEIANAHGLVGWHESWIRVLTELINGESFGLSLTDLDESHAAAARARRTLDRAIARYRDGLDAFKVTLGLAPDAAVAVDDSSLKAFRTVASALTRWSIGPHRDLAELDRIVHQYPALGDVTIDGRAILADLDLDPDRLPAILDQAARRAIAYHHATGAAADALALRIRRQVRHLAELQTDYRSELGQLTLAIRLGEDAFQQLIAPPTDPAPRRPALGIASLTAATSQNYATRARLVTLWTTFRAERHALNDDLGLVLLDDWPTFLGQFAAEAQPPAADPPGRPVEPVRIDGDPPTLDPSRAPTAPVRADPQR